MRQKFFLLALAMLLISVAYSQSVYYYTNGDKRYLKQEDNKRFVLVKTSDTTAFKRSCGISESPTMFFKPLILSDTSYMTKDFSWSIVDVDGKDVFANVDLEYDAPFFITENNEVVGLSHLFYVQLRDLEDTSLLRTIADNYKVEILGHNVYMPLWFTLACSNESSGNALEMANLFYESGLFEAAEPDIMVEGLLQCVNDPLFSQQWGLQNTGQGGGTEGVDIHYCSAQELTMGESYISVAIIDEGVDLQHADLPNVTSSYDLFDHQSQDEIYGPHGTACAGVIGASANNNVGVAGISPNCYLMSIATDFHINVDAAQRMADGIEWAWKHGASVISNSWTIKNTPVGLINAAIQDAVTRGRNGKGCVIVFSSGNDNLPYVEYPSSNENVISVGAIDRCGNRCVRVDAGHSCDYWDNYHKGSCYGRDLSVVAPGVNIPTTDISGFSGNSINDYWLCFLGTSSACPHVSGVAALMLSVDSNLLWTDVRDIIELTAQKVGDYEYEDDGIHTNGKWNEQTGYGLVDAHKAVATAKLFHLSYNINGIQSIGICEENTYTLIGTIPNGFNIEWETSPNLYIINGQGTQSVTVGALYPSNNNYIIANICFLETIAKQVNFDNIVSTGNGHLPLSNQDLIIDQNSILTTDCSFGSSLIVDSGFVYTITGILYCAPTARIIVRPGGRLVVDGGTLTSACDGEMWQGIVVEGHAIQPQSPANQGVVELKNGAVVENAVLGLDVKSGGIVTAEDATFRNCSTSVSFAPYAAAQLHGGIINNASHFLQCHFLTDGGNHFPEHGIGSNTHLHLWGVNGIGIKGCTFANTTGGQSGSRGYGIRAEDAGFNIDTYCPGGIFLSDCTCEPSDATYSTFQGFDKAVEANTTGNQYAVGINQARFTGNGTGVSINGNNYTTVTRCDFDLTQVPAGCVTTTGLRLSGCTGFLVEENSFHRTAGGMLPSTTGISVADAGISANSIYRNQFSNLTNGVYVTGSNGALKSGLRITCGAFSGNARDIHLASGATVARSFGSSLMGADNDFSHTSASSIYCAGGQNLNYYYSPATNHAPYNPSLSVTAYATATANGCRSTLCDNGPMQLPRDLSSADTHSLLSDSHGNASLSADRNIRLAMGDTVLDLDLLADWYEAVSEPSAKYALAETRFQQNTDNASVFSTIETEYLATDEDKAEYDNYRAFDALKKALALSSDGQSADWPSATPGQIAELQRIAEARTGRSSVMAQGVLCFFFDLCSDDFLESEQTTDTRSAEAPSVQPSGDGLVVSPNPTEGVLRVEGDGDISSVELYDTFGRLLLTQQCDGPLCILDIAGLNDGAYLLKVCFANGTVNSCKVVKK